MGFCGGTVEGIEGYEGRCITFVDSEKREQVVFFLFPFFYYSLPGQARNKKKNLLTKSENDTKITLKNPFLCLFRFCV